MLEFNKHKNEIKKFGRLKTFIYLCLIKNKQVMARKNYSGSDLGQDFKDFFRREKNRLTKIFKEKGCTNIQMNYGFYYFSGFFTSPSGQIYYFSASDVRHFDYNRLLIRTAKSYDDYTGGSNQFTNIDKQSLLNFPLK